MKKIALVLVLILGLCGSLYAQETVSSDIQILFLKQRIQILEQQLRIKDLEQEAMKKIPLESDMDAAAEVGASANSYTENFTPSLTADYLLGIDNFGEGGWAVNRFDLVNLQELFQQAPSTIGSGTPNTGAFTILSGTTITASVGYALSDGDYIGVTGEEVITWGNGTINVTNAAVDVDGAFTATSVASDAAVSGTTGTFSGVLVGALSVDTDADAHTLTSDEYHGGTVVATGAAVYTLPAAAADSGYSGCVENGQGVTSILQLLPADGDYIVFKGARGTAATSIKSPTGIAGSRICYWSYDADDWYVITSSATGAWAE
jgi:hypothetical protein